MANVVKIITDDDCMPYNNDYWHYAYDHPTGKMVLCSCEYYGIGESNVEYKESDGKITCQECIDIIKHFKSIKL
jgi:hypothetical protein